MFKRYKVKMKSSHPEVYPRRHYTVDFYVHSRSTKTGFCHEAAVIGPLPRKEGCNEQVNSDDRRARKAYLNRTWESWDGQSVLQVLWNKLLKLECVDTARFPKRNPFDSDSEPKHESLWEPDELFGR